LIYFLVIILSNTVGAVSGMGGGVIIKPVLDFFALDTVATISFYSTVAVFVMSIVSTSRQLKNGVQVKGKIVLWISMGSIIGGIFGSLAFEALLNQFEQQESVQFIQIILTILMLLFAFF